MPQPTPFPEQPSTAALSLTALLGKVRGLKPGQVSGLAGLGMHTIADLVRNLPMRYEQLEAEGKIGEMQAEQLVTVRGEITATRIAGFGRKQRFEAVLMDDTGRLDLIWFNQPYLRDRLLPGTRVRVHGKLRKHGPGLQLANPKHELLVEEKAEPSEADARVRPVYSASERILSSQIEAAVGVVLEDALKQIEDHFPELFREQRGLPSLAGAYRMAHQPASLAESRQARRRLAYDELFMLQLGVFLRRAQLRESSRAPALKYTPEIDRHIKERFPFALTKAQQRVIGEIAIDVSKPSPSNRLIQGDVGSGKTVVAMYAMLLAVSSGHQAAMLAPTELLAEQHWASVRRVLDGSNVRVELLTGSMSAAERSRVIAGLASGKVDIVVGTHAILSEHVRMKSLAVAVIDEQHRFGVHQRAALRTKGALSAEHGDQSSAESLLTQGLLPSPGGAQGEVALDVDGRTLVPHVLVMTATPIPRTLALTLFGDLDVSTIDELPPGRTPVTTRVVHPSLSGEVYRWLRERIEGGDQAYVVVPAIDTGASAAGAGVRGAGEADAELQDLRTVHARLEAHELAGRKVAALHGRLKPEVRDAIMARFRKGEIDCIVATTVIEVGVDVANATVMIVEHAERFGLAQLHQLRGRVGRGAKRSVCVLIGDPLTPDAEARLNVMSATSDGFVIAEKDLEIRGPGEVFGDRQAGAPPLKVADLMLDRELLAVARRDAHAWIERSPSLSAPGERLLRGRLMKAHGQWLGLGDVG